MSVPHAPPDPFLAPPALHNARGEVRRVGFELEYSGLDVAESAELVRRVFRGRDVAESTFVHRVEGTRFGDFQVEIDTVVLKDRKYESALAAVGLDVHALLDPPALERALLGAFSTVVPIEIVTPPIPMTELAALEDLRRLLRDARARGTRASLLYAFGLHINPEVAGNDPAELLDVLRAFVLLFPWVKRRVDLDMTRAASPFVDKFPVDYCKLIVRPGYEASRDRLIDDYLLHNPTRNRALDMLPVLAWLDRDRVRARLGPEMKLRPRPSLHYRLPNCLIDEPGWSLAREWNTWVAVERLAADKPLLTRMAQDYLTAEGQTLRPFYDKWPELVERYAPRLAAEWQEPAR